MTGPRIALIHALAHSVAPINEAMARAWPQAQRMNLLDDSLSADLAASAGGMDAFMFARFSRLARYAADCGSQGVLFTCSAFGPCIEAVARELAPLPVLKPNEAMIDDAARAVIGGGTVGLVATFGPTLASMPPEFPADVPLATALAAGALDRLNAGDADGHDERIVNAAQRLAEQGVQVLALAQFSMARAADRVREATGLPVLTTVDSAVARMQLLVETDSR